MDIYKELRQTKEMTDLIIRVMVDLLHMLALVTEEIKQKKISEFILDDRLPCSG